MMYADNRCVCNEIYEPEHVYVFTGLCIVMKKSYSVVVPAKELYAYRQGELIQNAMPSVSSDDREFLQSGMSPEGWGKAFSEDDES